MFQLPIRIRSGFKIGQIVKTKKPAITNDVVNDPRIEHPEWAGKRS
jgi:hypothetical protein